jgi:hypothetical protein
MFDPKTHLIQLPRRVKDPATGQYKTVHDDYLEVRWRVVMFREKYPHGTIITEEVCVDLEKGYARYKATVEDGEGGKATGYGTETKADFTDYAERAETRAIGRALALLGFGTQFVGADLSEGEHGAAAPVSPERRQQMVEEVATTAVNILRPDLANGSTPVPVPEPEREHLTAEAIDRLFELATAANEPKEALGSRLRNLLRLPGDVRISKKFLRERMGQAAYDAARAYYEGVIREQVEADVPDHEPPPSDAAPLPPRTEEATQPPAGATIDATPEEALAVPTDEPAPADDPADKDREIVRALALGWGLPASEVDHILSHHRDPAKAKNLLWAARLQRTRQPNPQPTLTESAA